jgi:hypothetical protein
MMGVIRLRRQLGYAAARLPHGVPAAFSRTLREAIDATSAERTIQRL